MLEMQNKRLMVGEMRLFRELMDFLKGLPVKDLQRNLIQRCRGISCSIQRIKSLEMSLGLKKKPVSPKSAKKEPDDDEKKEVERLAALLK